MRHSKYIAFFELALELSTPVPMDLSDDQPMRSSPIDLRQSPEKRWQAQVQHMNNKADALSSDNESLCSV